MKPISIWAANAQSEFTDLEPLAIIDTDEIKLEAYLSSDSFLLVYKWPDQSTSCFRTAFSASGNLWFVSREKKGSSTIYKLESSTFTYTVNIQFPESPLALFRYTVVVRPKLNLLIKFWPKDILSFNKRGTITDNGDIHTNQKGTRSGIIFFNSGIAGSVFYFQNLTAINDYFQQTETSAADTVGGSWPEVGFSLPSGEKPLLKNLSYTVSDAFITLNKEAVTKISDISTRYLDQLANTYLVIPRPERVYHNWLDTVENGLNDLLYHKGCWTFGGGHTYLNAYVADYKTPPEIMVQLAVLLPMMDYVAWKGEKNHQLIDELKAGIASFYQEDMGTIVRWLPALESQLDHSEEQKTPRVMDSWYLHHPLMNLARLAEKGEPEARDILMNSIDYVIRVAHKFKYEWPVFYQMDTLHIIKAETSEGEGGEKDVPGTYADLMLRVWKITGEKKYFEEAVKSAEHLKGLGFNIFYQANNTAYAAGALLRLYKETSKQVYLDLSYDCLAGIFNNVQLWECDYGHAKNFPTFFAVFPLKDAPYTAAYEEQEVYAALHDYLQQAEGIDILPSVRLLISEFVRHMLGRVAYYYPPMLTEDMLVKKTKTGEIDPKLWIALEDLHDGWEQNGEVGQEVYGAGIAFGVIPKQYFKVPGEDFTIFCDYPVKGFKLRKDTVSLTPDGDPALYCRIIILTEGNSGDHEFMVTDSLKSSELKPLKSNSKLIEYQLNGGQSIKIKWQVKKKARTI